jgi:hypothetical protein
MPLNMHTVAYPFEKSDLIQVIVYDASDRPEYIGYATPGTSKATAGWQIRKLTYDAGGLVTDTQFASGSNLYDKVWNDYAGYSYS